MAKEAKPTNTYTKERLEKETAG
ncbi:hypothetical protein LCGC14_1893480, partial [marine sediment metagenome]